MKSLLKFEYEEIPFQPFVQNKLIWLYIYMVQSRHQWIGHNAKTNPVIELDSLSELTNNDLCRDIRLLSYTDVFLFL